MDGRTREAKILQRVRAELTEHVGGSPSATQRALIERAAWLTLRTAQLDRKIAGGGELTDHDSRVYLAWSNSLTRTLRQLGHGKTRPAPRTLADYLAARPSPQAEAAT
ncbi:MAG TPA: hypothetical protein VGN83_20965 [Falsiroseomonas sp.]|jgi:hypothetical protein|nr:hypothetical protein [Falsiroseomonas sp.]